MALKGKSFAVSQVAWGICPASSLPFCFFPSFYQLYGGNLNDKTPLFQQSFKTLIPLKNAVALSICDNVNNWHVLAVSRQEIL